MNIDVEKVLFDEPHAVGNSGLLRILLCFLDGLGLYIDPGTTGLEPLSSRYHDPAIAAAEVVYDVSLLDVAEPAHRLDDLRGSRNVVNFSPIVFLLGSQRRGNQDQRA